MPELEVSALNTRTTLAEASRLHWIESEKLGARNADTVRASLGGNGDVRRLLQMALCIADHPWPTLTSISKATGQNKGVVDLSVARLETLGFEIQKVGSVYKMARWSPIFDLDAVRHFILSLETGAHV